MAFVIIASHLVEAHPAHTQPAQSHSRQITKNNENVIYFLTNYHPPTQLDRSKDVGVVGQSEKEVDSHRKNRTYKHQQVNNELLLIWIPEYHDHTCDECCHAVQCQNGDHIPKLVAEGQRSVYLLDTVEKVKPLPIQPPHQQQQHVEQLNE